MNSALSRSCWAALALTLVGCSKPASCPPGTVELTLTFDQSSAIADLLTIRLTAGVDAPAQQAQIAHTPGQTTQTLAFGLPDLATTELIGLSIEATIEGKPAGAGSTMSEVMTDSCIDLAVAMSSRNLAQTQTDLARAVLPLNEKSADQDRRVGAARALGPAQSATAHRGRDRRPDAASACGLRVHCSRAS
jgi:hypothetical protein